MRCSWSLVAALASAVSGCMKPLPSPEWEGPGWREITTPHFVISTDLEGHRALGVARSLEESRAAMLACAWSGSKGPPGITEVVALGRDTRHVLGRFQGKVFTQKPFGRMIVFEASSVGTFPEAIPHEIAHDLSRWYMPVQPVWFSEGLAVYLQSVTFDPEKQLATMGKPASALLKMIGHDAVIDVQALFAMNGIPESPRETRQLYASSWALVDHLLNVHDHEFGLFQDSLAKLEDWRSAWASAFAAPQFKRLDDELNDRLRRQQSVFANVPMSEPSFTTKLRKLSNAAVEGIYARIYLSNEDPARTGASVREALHADPSDLNALAVSFYALAPKSQQAEIADRALKAHPENGISWLMAADAAPNADAHLAALTQAKQRLPYHPMIRLRIAQEQIRRGRAVQALSDTRMALRLMGPDFEVVRAHLVALAANHRCSDAHRLSTNVIPGWPPEELRKLGEDLTPDEVYCAAHPDQDGPNSKMVTE